MALQKAYENVLQTRAINTPSFTISIVSPAWNDNSSVSAASYAYTVLHIGSLGLGAGLGLAGAGGFGRAAAVFDEVTL